MNLEGRAARNGFVSASGIRIGLVSAGGIRNGFVSADGIRIVDLLAIQVEGRARSALVVRDMPLVKPLVSPLTLVVSLQRGSIPGTWQKKAQLPAGVWACDLWHPQRESNPCCRLERAMSWATRRWGPVADEVYQTRHACATWENA